MWLYLDVVERVGVENERPVEALRGDEALDLLGDVAQRAELALRVRQRRDELPVRVDQHLQATSKTSNGRGSGSGTAPAWDRDSESSASTRVRVRVRAEWHLDFFDRVHDERVAEVLDRALEPVAERLHAERRAAHMEIRTIRVLCTSIL